MAQWCVRIAGLPDVLPQDRIGSALDTVERLNMRATAYGLINGVTPEGKPFDTQLNPSGDHARNIFVGENLCAAMTFVYHNRRDVGLEIARRLYETLAVEDSFPLEPALPAEWGNRPTPMGRRLLLQPRHLGASDGAGGRIHQAVHRKGISPAHDQRCQERKLVFGTTR